MLGMNNNTSLLEVTKEEREKESEVPTRHVDYNLMYGKNLTSSSRKPAILINFNCSKDMVSIVHSIL